MHPIATSLKNTLSQLQQLLDQLPDDEYSRPSDILSESSIGGHTRHIIEFFQTLQQGYPSGVVDYDARRRNKLLESNCSLAQAELAEIEKNILREDKKILLVGSYSNDPEQSTVESTYYRELVYNLEHAVHHMAMIRIAIRGTTMAQVPADFGVAASTMRYKRSR